jgi:hypothetical protein
MYADLHVTCLLYLFDFNGKLNFLDSFYNSSNIKCRENPSQRERGWDTRTDGRTGMKKLIITFRKFAKEPENAT